MEKESVNIIDNVLEKHLKGDLEAKIDIEDINEEHKNMCEKLNSVLEYEIECTKSAFEKECTFRKIFLQIGNLCNQILKGNLSKRMNILTIPFEMKNMGINLNTVFETLQKDIEILHKSESDLKIAISVFGFVLSKISKGDLSVKVDLNEISEEYETIGEDINSMILSIRKHIEDLQNRELELEKSKISTKYFKDYSEKILEFADDWGIGEVLKSVMKDWEKEHSYTSY